MVQRMRLALLSAVISTTALAHFTLESPAAVFNQGIVGDPQKAPPCGSDSSAVATNAITTYEAGQTVTIRINEKIFHPGHYRVSLGLTGPQDLPEEPPVTAGSTACGSTVIDPAPTFPVLADGQLLHTTAFSGTQSFQVTIPANITCTNCTLQVLEFMSNHGLNNPGGCYYHHCATINVVAPGTDAGTQPAPVNHGCSSVDGLLLLALPLLLRRRGPG